MLSQDATPIPGWYLEVDAAGHGERLDQFITRRLSRVSRNRASRLQVTDIDHPQRIFKKSTRLKSKQRLWIARPVPKEDVSALKQPQILFQNEDVLIVNKPSGWAIHPTASRFFTCITTWLQQQGYIAEPAHRLDVETSGLLICGCHQKSTQALVQAFRQQEVVKNYLAICKGSLPIGTQWSCHQPLGFDTKSIVKLKIAHGTWPAHTDIEVIANHTTHNFMCIKATPKSGRQHQIRVHLAMSEHGILGDKLYFIDESYFLLYLAGELTASDYIKLGHKRHALHANFISFKLLGKVYQFKAPWPSDLHQFFPHPHSSNV